MAALLALFLPGLPAPAGAAAPVPGAALTVGPVQVQLVADRDAAVPGQPLRLGLWIRHQPHWHTYWRNPGDSGMPTQIDWHLPAGMTASDIEWPMPQRIGVGPLANFGLQDEVVLPVRTQVPASFDAATLAVQAQATWLVCKDVCIPGEATLALDLPVRAQSAPSAQASLYEDTDARRPAGAPLAARWFAQGDRISLVFDSADPPRSLEFFPYESELVRPAAPQRLSREGQSNRVELERPDHAPAWAADQPIAGEAWLDGRPVAIVAQPGQGTPPRGAPIGVSVVVEFASTASPGTLQAGRDAGRFGTPGNGPQPQLSVPGSRAGAAPGGAGLADGARGAGAAAAAPGLGEGWGATPVVAAPSLARLALMTLSAFVGGLLLNLMPCVLPIVGLKLLAFGGSDDGRARASLAFSAGIVATFWSLSAIMLALRGAGQAVGWGFQLQSPAFVAALTLLFVLIGLNLAGVFEVGAGAGRLGDLGARLLRPRAQPTGAVPQGMAGQFGAGVLTTLVATPCAAPFMGSAIGFTIDQPAAVLLLVMTALGLGMAAPYLVFAGWPRLLRRLPRPGAWMESLRTAMAFPMFATAVWLAWVLTAQRGSEALLRLGMAAVLVAFAAWCYGRFVQRGSTRRGVAQASWVVALLAALWLLLPVLGDATDGAADDGAQGLAASAARSSGDGAAWQAWSPEAVASVAGGDRPVFVEFTAAWCITCQVNHRVVLDAAVVADAFARQRVQRFRADWTRPDERIRAALAARGRSGVPMYLVWRAGEREPQLLPELLTPGIVLEALGGPPPVARR